MSFRFSCYRCVIVFSLTAINQTSYLAQVAVETTRSDTNSTQLFESESTSQDSKEIWNLSELEWERVANLKEGIRGTLSIENISPVEILGIHARNEHDRRRYAELWAKIVYEDTQRILAFQHAFDAAMRELTQGQNMIDLSRLPNRKATQHEFNLNDRLVLFDQFPCGDCRSTLARIRQVLHRVGGLDIYIQSLDAEDEYQLRQWAESAGISRLEVRSRRITLNFDSGLLQKIRPEAPDPPILMKRQGDQFQVIQFSALP